MSLFKGKLSTKKVKEEKPAKESQFKGMSIGKILWAGFLVMAIVTLLSGYSSYLLYAEVVDDNRENQQRAIAERAATTFTVRFDALNQQIKRILSLQSVQQTLNDIPAGTLNLPESLQQSLTEQLPDLMRQLVVDASTAPDDQLTPPLSYACLELSSQQNAMLELHRFGTADQHLDIAFPLENGRSLLLSFNPRLVHQWLKGIDSGESYIVLQQQIEGHDPLAFGQTGNVRLAGTGNHIIHPIPGTKFQVAVTLPKIEPLAQVERLLFFVNFGVTLILVALILWATLVTIRLVLRKDLHTISSLIKRSAISMHHTLPIKLAELRGCAEDIKHHLGISDNVSENKAVTKPKERENDVVPLSQTHITVDVEPEPDTETSSESKEETK